MKVIFHHSHAFDWEVIDPAKASKSDVLGTNPAGDTVRRVSKKSVSTDVQFAPGAIDVIHGERDEAGLRRMSDKALIARHLEDAVVPAHFDPSDLTDITVQDGPAGLREYLLDHFAVKPRSTKGDK